MKEELKNRFCVVEYRPDEKEIFGRDLTDHFNDPAFYTKSKRGLKNAWEAVKQVWTDKTEMSDVIRFLESQKIRTHFWCMVD